MDECIPNVIERKKWSKDTRQLQVGDHVLVIDENARHRHLATRLLKLEAGHFDDSYMSASKFFLFNELR